MLQGCFMQEWISSIANSSADRNNSHLKWLKKKSWLLVFPRYHHICSMCMVTMDESEDKMLGHLISLDWLSIFFPQGNIEIQVLGIKKKTVTDVTDRDQVWKYLAVLFISEEEEEEKEGDDDHVSDDENKVGCWSWHHGYKMVSQHPWCYQFLVLDQVDFSSQEPDFFLTVEPALLGSRMRDIEKAFLTPSAMSVSCFRCHSTFLSLSGRHWPVEPCWAWSLERLAIQWPAAALHQTSVSAPWI